MAVPCSCVCMCGVCFSRKGNNELLLSMQFIETCYPIRPSQKSRCSLAQFQNCDTAFFSSSSSDVLYELWMFLPFSVLGQTFIYIYFHLFLCHGTWIESIFFSLLNTSSQESRVFPIFQRLNCLKNMFCVGVTFFFSRSLFLFDDFKTFSLCTSNVFKFPVKLVQTPKGKRKLIKNVDFCQICWRH